MLGACRERASVPHARLGYTRSNMVHASATEGVPYSYKPYTKLFYPFIS